MSLKVDGTAVYGIRTVLGEVISFNGRSGTVTSQPGDYSAGDISYNDTNTSLGTYSVQAAIEALSEKVSALEQSMSTTQEQLGTVSDALTEIVGGV